MAKKSKLYTIGHSTRPIAEFLQLLEENKIALLVDVRTIPKSRFVPQYNQEKLKNFLQQHKINYIHMPELGGMRKTRKDSINTAWRNANFRGYADYMQTAEFKNALDKLNDLLNQYHKIAIMCAEAVPWRCHRSLIADAEVAHKIQALHIIHHGEVNPHQLTDFARVGTDKDPLQVWYPASS